MTLNIDTGQGVACTGYILRAAPRSLSTTLGDDKNQLLHESNAHQYLMLMPSLGKSSLGITRLVCKTSSVCPLLVSTWVFTASATMRMMRMKMRMVVMRILMRMVMRMMMMMSAMVGFD